MRDELIRAVVAAPVVVTLPGALGARLHPRPARVGLCLVLMAAALSPELGSWRPWAVIAIVTIVAALPRAKHAGDPRVLGLSAVAVALLAAAIIDQTVSRHAVAHVSDAREIVIVLAGFVAAVFLAGAVIGRLLHPFALKLHRGTVPGIENAGRMIGWLERTLLYGLILAGAPDAAAIVIAAKSVARFPAFSEESFAEYYLIGTLLSFLIAAGIGVAVRAALGLPPLPSGPP